MRQYFQIAFFLGAVWLLFSQQTSPHYLIAGAVSIVMSLWVLRRINALFPEQEAETSWPRMAKYLAWLFTEIVRSASSVSRKIWQRKRFHTPVMADINITSMKSGKAKVAYANSITVTPGTIAAALTDNMVVVHVLSAEDAPSLKKGNTLQQKTSALYGE